MQYSRIILYSSIEEEGQRSLGDVFIRCWSRKKTPWSCSSLQKSLCRDVGRRILCKAQQGEDDKAGGANSIQTETSKVEGNRFSMASPITTTDNTVACDLGADYVGH